MALIRNIHLSPARQTILAGLVFIARTMGIAILAEGVETRDEMMVLSAPPASACSKATSSQNPPSDAYRRWGPGLIDYDVDTFQQIA